MTRLLRQKRIRQPYAIELYSSLVALWQTGGILSDLTHLFLGHLEDWQTHMLKVRDETLLFPSVTIIRTTVPSCLHPSK